jgi:hypothetical protein
LALELRKNTVRKGLPQFGQGFGGQFFDQQFNQQGR